MFSDELYKLLLKQYFNSFNVNNKAINNNGILLVSLYKAIHILNNFLKLPHLLKKRDCLIYLLLFFAATAYSQESTLIINSTTRQKALDAYINILHSKKTLNKIEDVLQASEKKWISLNSLSGTYNKPEGWFRLQFKSSVSVDQFIIYLPIISKAEAFIVQDDQIKGSFKGGEFELANSKAMLSSRKSFVIPLHLSERGSFEVYIKAENFKREGIDFNWRFEPFSDWIWDYYYYTVIDTIFHSVNLVLIVSACLLFIFLRQRRYLYYASYLLTISIYFLWDAGYMSNYLLGNWPKLNYSLKVLQNVAPICYIFFLFNFQPFQEKKVKSHKIYWSQEELKLCTLVHFALASKKSLFLVLCQNCKGLMVIQSVV